MDKRILAALNATNAFKDKGTNNANTGKASREIAELWNTEQPDDPVS